MFAYSSLKSISGQVSIEYIIYFFAGIAAAEEFSKRGQE